MTAALQELTHESLAPGTSGLRLRSLTSGYGEVVVLRDVSLAIPFGEVVAILGPNGAGKTTLLRSILGTTRIRSGQVELDGRDITGWPPHRVARAGFCYVPEGRAIYRTLTVNENLRLFAGSSAGGPLNGKAFRAAVERVYEIFPVLADRSKQTAGTLSGGQQQMLALSRSLVRDYRMLLVDELSMGLAPVVIDELFEVLGRLKQAGLTIVVVEQYVERALAVCDLVYVMARGQVVLAGEAAEVRDNPELVSAYLEAG